MSEPTTEAGRRLFLSLAADPDFTPDEDEAAAAIAAIEAEARAAEHDRLARISWAADAMTVAQARADLAHRIEERLAKAPPVVFMPEDIERIYAGEALSLLPRHAVLAAIREEAAK